MRKQDYRACREELLLDAGETDIDGFILPGHVSSIIGSDAWNFIAGDYGKPGIVAGFEDHDLLKSTLVLLALVLKGEAEVVNGYGRAVKSGGNERLSALCTRCLSRLIPCGEA